MELNQVMHISYKDILGAGLVVGAGLLIIFFILLVILLIFYSRKRYYERIRLGNPKLDKPTEKKRFAWIRGIARAIILIILICGIALMLFYLVKTGMSIATTKDATPKGLEIGAANLSEEVAETPEQEAILNLSNEQAVLIEEPGSAMNQTAKSSPFMDGAKEFILTYAGYIALGFIILIILISVLGARKQN